MKVRVSGLRTSRMISGGQNMLLRVGRNCRIPWNIITEYFTRYTHEQYLHNYIYIYITPYIIKHVLKW